ncbi:hypothetical protein FISHEDRAFT_55552 [Fistulina hepatica ATCC 64428]|uniref:Uncharacterized protein n=1 Tax=Fistulina hepatica ATCC 64428 TaxID=1128425 RepID=A0A0D7AMV0_9AGAR|nr:hypothetical protein FISHEDRAFT_55552 [Fistulina hepatica ATCC 64428]
MKRTSSQRSAERTPDVDMDEGSMIQNEHAARKPQTTGKHSTEGWGRGREKAVFPRRAQQLAGSGSRRMERYLIPSGEWASEGDESHLRRGTIARTAAENGIYGGEESFRTRGGGDRARAPRLMLPTPKSNTSSGSNATTAHWPRLEDAPTINLSTHRSFQHLQAAHAIAMVPLLSPMSATPEFFSLFSYRASVNKAELATAPCATSHYQFMEKGPKSMESGKLSMGHARKPVQTTELDVEFEREPLRRWRVNSMRFGQPQSRDTNVSDVTLLATIVETVSHIGGSYAYSQRSSQRSSQQKSSLHAIPNEKHLLRMYFHRHVEAVNASGARLGVYRISHQMTDQKEGGETHVKDLHAQYVVPFIDNAPHQRAPYAQHKLNCPLLKLQHNA